MKPKEKTRKGKGGLIFRPWITLPGGKRLYAKDFGIKAFPIRVR